jgi:hypothetical protein
MDHANIQLGCRTEPVFYNVRRKSKTIGNHLHKTIDTPEFSEYNADYAWSQSFLDGAQFYFNRNYDYDGRVRPVRAF